MKDGSTQPCVMFPELFGKPLVARFDQPHGSSDGGAVLLKACDERLRLTESLAACFRDGRPPGKVMHTLHDLIRQRVFAIACGYADCNDAARLADDPIRKLLVDRDPIEGKRWPRKPRCRALRTRPGRRCCIGWVSRSVRRIVLNLPQYAPWRSDWCRVARCLGAAPR